MVHSCGSLFGTATCLLPPELRLTYCPWKALAICEPYVICKLHLLIVCFFADSPKPSDAPASPGWTTGLEPTSSIDGNPGKLGLTSGVIPCLWNSRQEQIAMTAPAYTGWDEVSSSHTLGSPGYPYNYSLSVCREQPRNDEEWQVRPPHGSTSNVFSDDIEMDGV
jgi:hypothetical protein